MVDYISPNYYASGNHRAVFTLEGFNFELIPANAVGVIALANDHPLEYRYTQDVAKVVPITQHERFELTLEQDAVYYHSYRMYLGAIVSEDRQTVYWINERQPIPA